VSTSYPCTGEPTMFLTCLSNFLKASHSRFSYKQGFRHKMHVTEDCDTKYTWLLQVMRNRYLRAPCTSSCHALHSAILWGSTMSSSSRNPQQRAMPGALIYLPSNVQHAAMPLRRSCPDRLDLLQRMSTIRLLLCAERKLHK
jgi:hypothetical protein